MNTSCRFFALVLGMIAFAAIGGAQDWAKKRLEDSPRHGEWVQIKHGDRTVDAFVVYPEVSEKATAVIVIHEIFGLTDWVRGVADQLAEKGFIAIAPDLLSQMGKDGGNTASFGGEEVRRAIMSLPPDQITADLNAAAEYAVKLPACNGKFVVTGFCWGGGQTFRFATNNSQMLAAFPFYGPSPTEAAEIARITCPVHGFYAENDERVNSTVEKSQTLMKEAGKSYEPVFYQGAGHGFMRAGEAPDASAENKKAREEGWARLVELIRKAEQ
jgi:carboxymethylenebutenolidase